MPFRRRVEITFNSPKIVDIICQKTEREFLSYLGMNMNFLFGKQLQRGLLCVSMLAAIHNLAANFDIHQNMLAELKRKILEIPTP
jgi:hypothetical protein